MGRTSTSTSSELDPDRPDPSFDPAPGKSTRTEQLSAHQGHGAGLPFLDVMLASSPTGHPVQRKENEFASFNSIDKDPATGLVDHQERAVTELVSRVHDAVATWEQQRGTPDLVFKANGDVKLAFKLFREHYIADPSYELLLREAARRMKDTRIPAYAREIRMFNYTSLIELKGLLDLGDVEPTHSYEFLPVWGASAGGSGQGIKAGFVSKTILVRYTNTAIPALSWTQQVKLSGIQLGFNLGLKGALGASGSGPGDEWKPASGNPQLPYYAPDFFQDASFTSPSASASVGFGPASVKKGLGQALLIEKFGQRLRWDMPMGAGILDDVEVEAGVDSEMIDEARKNNGVSYKPELGAEAVNEFGSTELDGELDFNAGEWGEIEPPEPEEDDETWVPLHYARVFFDTGSSALLKNDFDTIQQVVNAIKIWDKRPNHRGSIFKVDISGCHSQQWSEYDDDLRALDARRDADGELHGNDVRREGDLLAKKELENYELAMARAQNTHLVFSTFLDRIQNQMVYGVMANSEVAEPTTHEPLGANPYGDRDEDRSATILVSYKIFSKHRQVNWNAADPI